MFNVHTVHINDVFKTCYNGLNGFMKYFSNEKHITGIDIHAMHLLDYHRSDKITWSLKHDISFIRLLWRMIHDVQDCFL